MLVTLPFVLLLLDYWPLCRTEARRPDEGRQLLRLVIEKIPLIALSVGSNVVTFLVQRKGHSVGLSSCPCRPESTTRS